MQQKFGEEIARSFWHLRSTVLWYHSQSPSRNFKAQHNSQSSQNVPMWPLISTAGRKTTSTTSMTSFMKDDMLDFYKVRNLVKKKIHVESPLSAFVLQHHTTSSMSSFTTITLLLWTPDCWSVLVLIQYTWLMDKLKYKNQFSDIPLKFREAPDTRVH